MTEGSRSTRFTDKAIAVILIRRDPGAQHLDRSVALQARISGKVDFTHAAGAQETDDLVRPESRSGRERHSCQVWTIYETVSTALFGEARQGAVAHRLDSTIGNLKVGLRAKLSVICIEASLQ